MSMKIDETKPLIDFDGVAGPRAREAAAAVVSGFFQAGMVSTEIVPAMFEALALVMVILSPTEEHAVQNLEGNIPHVVDFIKQNWGNREIILENFGVVTTKPEKRN